MRSSSRKRTVVARDSEELSEDDFLPEVVSAPTPPVSTNENSFQLIVEKVLGRKFMKVVEGSDEVEELFFIKWKGLSYLHVSWERCADIERVDPNGKAKVKRFLQSPQARIESIKEKGDEDELEDDIEYFHPSLAEVQRIICCSDANRHAKISSVAAFEELAANGDEEDRQIQYLVKWRGLPYNECTWETFEDLKDYCLEVSKN